MPSFVNRGVKMFEKGDGPSLKQKRSEGRMKRYDSCQDLRAWCDSQEERRRYMLELMANPPSGGGGGGGAGRYVPFATLIELLQTLKDGQIVGLQKKLDELENELAAYRKLNLTDEQRAQLQGLMGSVKKARQELDKAGPSKDSAKKDKDSTTVLFKRKDDGHSSGADSDTESQDLRKLLAERDAQIKDLKSQLDAKNGEIAQRDQVMKTAQEKVDSVSGKVDDNSQLRAQLEKTKDELNTLRAQYDELKRKSSNCDDVLAERDALRMRVKDYEKMNDEMEKLRYRAKEADVLRMERDRLKERVDELSTIETAYMKLLQETADYEQIAAEREIYKQKYEELAGSNNDLEAMDDELKHLQGIEQERDYLLRELNELRCTIADQEDEIQRLLIMVEKLSAGNNNKEERLVKGLSSMRIEMEKRDDRIAELEAQLADMPALEEEIRNLRDRLKDTIVTVAQDKDKLSTSESKLKAELDESGKMLEHARQEVSEYMEQLAALQRENDSLRSQLEALRAASGGDTELQDELVRERGLREQAEQSLRDALDKLEKLAAEKDKAMTSLAEKQSGSKELLEHSESKYLREKEAKDLLQGVLDVTQDELENEKSTRRALEEKIKELEALLANTAKSSDSNRKMSLDMANEIEQLKAQLDAEKKKCEEMMQQGTSSASSNDLKNMKIQAEANEKIQALEKQLSELQAENEDLKNKLAAQGANADGSDRIKELEKQVQDLRTENERLKSLGSQDGNDLANANADGSDRIKELEKQVQDLRTENERLKSLGSQDGNDLANANAALEEKIRGLLAEMENLDKSTKKQINDLLAENERLRKSAQSDDCSDLIEEAAKEKAKMEAIIKKLEAQLKTISNQPADDDNSEDCATDCEEQLEKFKKKIGQLQAENQKLQSQLDGKAPADASAELDKLRKKISDLEGEIEQLKAENAKLKAAGGSGGKSQAECEEELGNMRKKLAQVETEKQNLQTKMDSAAPPDTKAELDSLRTRVSGLEAENDKLKAEIEKLKSTGATKDDKAVADCEKELENLRKKMNASEAEKEKKEMDCEKEMDALRKKIASLEASGASEGEKEKKQVDCEKEIDALKKKIASLEASGASEGEKEKKQVDCEKEIDALKKKIASLEASGAAGGPVDNKELDSLRKKCQGLEDENDKLKAELGSLKKKLEKLEQDNKDLQKAVDSKAPADSRKEIEDLRKKVASLEAEKERLNRDKEALEDTAAKLSKSFEDRLANMTRDSLTKIKQSVEKFKGSLSPEDHAKNIKETEDKYEQRIAKLKEDYERRLADMIEQNKKNTDQYTLNLASLKEIYERDMKALNERHNESVLRLQNLHEQEIREINDNYDKEISNIEASNNGSLTEVRKQSRDTVKNLKAMHDSELDKLRKEYEDKINKLIAEHNEDKERLTKKLNMDLKERDNRLQELEKSKLGGQEEKGGKDVVREKQDELEKGNSAEETRLKYEAMLNRLTDSNDKKLQLLKDRYEQLLEEERRKNGKSFQQLEQTKTDVHEVRPESGRLPLSVLDGEGSSSDKLIAILNKILATGIDSLTFEELSFLHECICAASGKKILSNPDLKLSTMLPELHGMDKKELCSRVQILEKELTRRDKETQRKVCCLEKCVMNEKRRLEELRQTLTHEQRKCVELGSQHDMMKKETANCADRARNAMKELERERGKCCGYELQLKQLRAANRHLQSLLDRARQPSPSHPCGGKDADPVRAIRMTLDASLETEAKQGAKPPSAAGMHRNQVPTRQPAPSRRSDQRLAVTYTDPLEQGPSPRSPYPTAEPGSGGRNPRTPVCNAAVPSAQCKTPSHVAEAAVPRKPCPQTCGAAKPFTELQVLTQRDTFVSACGARLASKKSKKGSK